MKRLILYDIQYSFRKNRLKWLAAIIIQLFLCIRSFGEVSFGGGPYELLSELWPVMSGAREYILSEDSSFQLPAYWFLFHSYLFFLIGFYPVSELHLGNGQALVRTHTRESWLVSKLISVIINVTLYYGCFLVLLLLGNFICGGTVMPRNGIISLSGIPIFDRSFTELLTAFILLPLSVSITLGCIQVVLSLFLDPVFSFMLVIGYMVASVFWTSPLLIGSFSMLYRQEWVSGQSEMTLTAGMLWCLCLTALAIIGGIYMFRRKDILPSE